MRRSFVLSLACHALLALLLLAGAWVWPGRGLKAPPVLAEVELVVQNTPAVGQTAAAASAAPAARPPAEPAAPADTPPPSQSSAAPAASLPLPPPPAPAAPPVPASTPPAARPEPAPSTPPTPVVRPSTVRLGKSGAAGTGLVSGSQVIPAAIDSAVRNVPPAYPQRAVREGEQGSVILKVHIAADGSATAVDIFRTSGYPLLDRAARGAVGHWHFVPARQAELPVSSTMLVKIRFVLNNPESGE